MVLIWLSFFFLVVFMLVFDLKVLHKSERPITPSNAIGWSVFWILSALLFNVLIYYLYEGNWTASSGYGKQKALEFFTGYIVEKSLSLDNLFVMAIIFQSYSMPLPLQHRVLYWGVLGALVMRLIMIVLGVALIKAFSWMTYVFGAILLIAAIKILFRNEEAKTYEEGWIIKKIRTKIPVTKSWVGHHFFVQEGGIWKITPLFLVLLQIEVVDLIFAFDSIPAIFAITQDSFIIFTSNVFAVLGLRALYFALSSWMKDLYYLQITLGVLLLYIAVKMLLSPLFHIPIGLSLGVIVAILTVGIVASLRKKAV